MGENAIAKNENNARAPSNANSWGRLLLPSAIIVIVISALLSSGLCFWFSSFTTAKEAIVTFWISFLVGLGGAGIYLSLLLMTEKNLKVLENNLTKNLGFMTFLFLLSGGFVAAVTQVSTGTLLPNGLQAVFMIGFGWLGALSGVAATGTRAQLNEENRNLSASKNKAETERDSGIEGLKNENIELRKKLEEAFNQIDALQKGGR